MSDANELRRPFRPAVRAMALLLLAALAACGPGGPGEDEAAESVDAERYELEGEVVAADAERGTLTVAHEEIPGFMGAMTMPFNVREDWVFAAADPGARIQATLVVAGDASWLEEIVITGSPEEGAAARAVVEAAEPGARVPEIPLVNQDGETIGLEDHRGAYLVLTFIYTRCPLPDFCTRMSAHFARLREAIEADPRRYGDARLLSVTIDPEYDTPEVLREYASRYVDTDAAAAFSRWQFARAEPTDLAELAQFTGLRYHPGEDEVVHNLRTALIDPEGRVLEVIVGNAWEPEEVLATLETAAAGTS